MSMPPLIVVVMGVSGCGKSTVGQGLARALGCGFAEGDDYHPSANVEKMRQGIALTDDDRWPWLPRMAEEIARWEREDERKVLTCSALKKAYRQILVGSSGRLRFLYLQGTASVIRARLEARHGHFMPARLLDSQFRDLEEPGDEEQVVTLTITESPARLLERAVAAFRTNDALETMERGEDP